MSLFIEIHLIQNFAPSNLNRDDTGAPKDVPGSAASASSVRYVRRHGRTSSFVRSIRAFAPKSSWT